MKDWPRHFLCHWCWKGGLVCKATMRAFAGKYGGGGWAACGIHENKAIEEALRSMFSTSIKLIDGFNVQAFRVEVHPEGFPIMTARLFTARRKEIAAT